MKRKPRNTGARADRGAVLMVALVLVFALSAGAAVVWKGLHSQLDSSRIARHQEQAYWLAEAGVQHAAALLNSGATAVEPTQEHPLGDGSYRIEVLDRTSDAGARIVAAGRSGMGPGPARAHEVRLEARLSRHAGGAYRVAALTRMREES